MTITMFPGAKIKMEVNAYSSNDICPENGGTVTSDNGIAFINQTSIYGDLKKLYQLMLLFEKAVNE